MINGPWKKIESPSTPRHLIFSFKGKFIFSFKGKKIYSLQQLIVFFVYRCIVFLLLISDNQTKKQFELQILFVVLISQVESRSIHGFHKLLGCVRVKKMHLDLYDPYLIR